MKSLRRHVEPGSILTSDGGEVQFAKDMAPAPSPLVEEFGAVAKKLATIAEAQTLALAAVAHVREHLRQERVRKLMEKIRLGY